MKEQVLPSSYGPELYVYPYLSENATPREMGSAGYVNARHYFPSIERDEGQSPIYGVSINMSGGGLPMAKDRSDKLVAAITRCWEWIAEREIVEQRLREAGGK